MIKIFCEIWAVLPESCEGLQRLSGPRNRGDSPEYIIRDGFREAPYQFRLWYDPDYRNPSRYAEVYGAWLLRYGVTGSQKAVSRPLWGKPMPAMCPRTGNRGVPIPSIA
jgi:hypothetical protein